MFSYLIGSLVIYLGGWLLIVLPLLWYVNSFAPSDFDLTLILALLTAPFVFFKAVRLAHRLINQNYGGGPAYRWR